MRAAAGSSEETIATIAGWIRAARSVSALTGAGVSTDSGIPDYRGPQGIWTKDPAAQQSANIQTYMTDPDARRRHWRRWLDGPTLKARPNDVHRAFVTLEHKDRLDTLCTQNVDGLHQAAGTSPERVVELHGNVRRYRCMSCGEGGPTEDVLARVEAGEDDPACLHCGGIIKTTGISFGQSLVAGDLERAHRAAARADVFVAAGTSLAVFPAAYLPQVAQSAGARVVVLNAQPTSFDDQADAVVRAPLGETLPRIAELV